MRGSTAEYNENLCIHWIQRFHHLVRETGLEPVRRRHTPLKRACLPVPALAHIRGS